jgi:hypothetical protein
LTEAKNQTITTLCLKTLDLTLILLLEEKADLDKGYNHDDYLQSHGYNIIEETVYYPGSWRIETNREDLLIDN